MKVGGSQPGRNWVPPWSARSTRVAGWRMISLVICFRAGASALLFAAALAMTGCSLMPADTELSIRSMSITHFYGEPGDPDVALGRQQVMATGNTLRVNSVAPVDSRGRRYHHSELSLVVLATSATSPDPDSTQELFRRSVEQGRCRVELPRLGVLPATTGAALPASLDLPSGRQTTVWLSAVPSAGPAATATLRCQLTRSANVRPALDSPVETASFQIEFR